MVGVFFFFFFLHIFVANMNVTSGIWNLNGNLKSLHQIYKGVCSYGSPLYILFSLSNYKRMHRSDFTSTFSHRWMQTHPLSVVCICLLHHSQMKITATRWYFWVTRKKTQIQTFRFSPIFLPWYIWIIMETDKQTSNTPPPQKKKCTQLITLLRN